MLHRFLSLSMILSLAACQTQPNGASSGRPSAAASSSATPISTPSATPGAVSSNASAASPEPSVSVTPHPIPSFSPGPSYQLKMDKSAHFSEDELKPFGCQSVELRPAQLGGLQPGGEIAECLMTYATRFGDTTRENLLRLHVQQLSTYSTQLIVRDSDGGGLHLLKTRQDLQARFAPVETPEEALSFVLATEDQVSLLTSDWLHAPRPLANPREIGETGPSYQVDRLEGTRVETVEGGFMVRHLLSGGHCDGNNGFPFAASVDDFVSRSGEVQRQSASIQIGDFGPCPVE